MRDKLRLTQELTALIPQDQKISVDEAMSLWWTNPRTHSGLRLTDAGWLVLRGLELAHWDYALEEDFRLTLAVMLQLDQKLQMPYYIHHKKKQPVRISFFSSREAMMVNLYSDFQKFIDNYSP